VLSYHICSLSPYDRDKTNKSATVFKKFPDSQINGPFTKRTLKLKTKTKIKPYTGRG